MRIGSNKVAKLVMLGMATALLIAMQVVLSSDIAQARCAGAREVRSNLILGAYGEAVVEYPEWTTCNHNRVYAGYVDTNWPDGWRAEVEIRDGDDGGFRLVAACATALPACRYTYYTGQYAQVRMRLCLHNVYTGQVFCGWGNRYAAGYRGASEGYYGTNWGY